MWNKKILYFILIGIASLGVCAQPAVRQGYSIHFPDTYTKWQEALLAGNGKMGIMVLEILCMKRWYSMIALSTFHGRTHVRLRRFPVIRSI